MFGIVLGKKEYQKLLDQVRDQFLLKDYDEVLKTLETMLDRSSEENRLLGPFSNVASLLAKESSLHAESSVGLLHSAAKKVASDKKLHRHFLYSMLNSTKYVHSRSKRISFYRDVIQDADEPYGRIARTAVKLFDESVRGEASSALRIYYYRDVFHEPAKRNRLFEDISILGLIREISEEPLSIRAGMYLDLSISAERDSFLEKEMACMYKKTVQKIKTPSDQQAWISHALNRAPSEKHPVYQEALKFYKAKRPVLDKACSTFKEFTKT